MPNDAGQRREEDTAPKLEMPLVDAALEEEIAALRAWLRSALARRLEQLRKENDGTRAELDALLEAVPPEPVPGGPPLPSSITNLALRLDLRAHEHSVLAVLLAAALEPNLGRALGLLFDPLARGAPTWDAVAALLGLPITHCLGAEDGLQRWRLVSVTAGVLVLDSAIEARLAGRPGRDTTLIENLNVIPLHEPLPTWPIAELAESVDRAVRAGARGVRIWLRGPEGSGRRTLFAAVARSLELVGASLAAGAGDADTVRAAVRLSWLDGLAIAWHDAARLPADLPVTVLQGWLGTESPPPIPGVAELTLTMPPLDRAARYSLWESLVPAFAEWPAEEQATLVDAWAARPGQLLPIALSGATTPGAASALLRAEARQRLEGTCETLETSFVWDDLVLPDRLETSLRELCFEARTLPSLWDDPSVRRLFPQGRSVVAMFAGPPGTGKTMAAQVVAREIGLPLFRVDLSRMVSKYIGETSQNLARLLDAARDTDAVIFFDEADALFGKRTEVKDAHDRYANTETDFLLQALDSWPGIAILATNRKDNIDNAFLRRMRMTVDFPRPSVNERRRIWKRLVDALVGDPDGALAPVVDGLSEQLEFSGAQIKGAILTAYLIARKNQTGVDAAHLVRGVERELEKEGRGLSARDRQRLLETTERASRTHR